MKDDFLALSVKGRRGENIFIVCLGKVMVHSCKLIVASDYAFWSVTFKMWPQSLNISSTQKLPEDQPQLPKVTRRDVTFKPRSLNNPSMDDEINKVDHNWIKRKKIKRKNIKVYCR